MDRASLDYITRTVLQAMADAEKAAAQELGDIEPCLALAASTRHKSLEHSILKLSL